MKGWGKLVAGALIGVAGTIYATDEEFRKRLPAAARDLPETVRRRFESAVSEARGAYTDRRAEILRELAERDHRHAGFRVESQPVSDTENEGESPSINQEVR